MTSLAGWVIVWSVETKHRLTSFRTGFPSTIISQKEIRRMRQIAPILAMLAVWVVALGPVALLLVSPPASMQEVGGGE